MLEQSAGGPSGIFTRILLFQSVARTETQAAAPSLLSTPGRRSTQVLPVLCFIVDGVEWLSNTNRDRWRLPVDLTEMHSSDHREIVAMVSISIIAYFGLRAATRTLVDSVFGAGGHLRKREEAHLHTYQHLAYFIPLHSSLERSCRGQYVVLHENSSRAREHCDCRR